MIKERIDQLRTLMRERSIDAYLVPTADYHESEYVGEYFKCRRFITGFSGSAGVAVITKEEANLWTDGRYFVQAAKELEGTGVILRKMGVEGVPTTEEYLQQVMPEKGVLGFDGKVVNAAMGEELQKKLSGKQIAFSYQEDLIGSIWNDRPELSAEPVWILEEKYTGKSSADKIVELREEMKKAGADVHILTTLDDIVWLLNIRGNDTACNPVVLSYVVVTQNELKLYINEKVVSAPVKDYLLGLGVTILPYGQIYTDIKEYKNQTILLEKSRTNYAICNNLDNSNQIINQMNPTAPKKAIKNTVEVENMKRAHVKDGIVMAKFIYWLKKNVGKIPMDEVMLANHLDQMRAETEGNLGVSFDTISAYGANAAMCHYHAQPETSAKIAPKGFYLVDSGGQYYEGTTDITRTIAMGPLTDVEKEHFTLIAMCMLRLGNAKFLHGCRGLNLDYLARGPLWERGLNFDHGTGHGVGYLLNVHERPNGIRWKMVAERQDSCILEPGMITSDEPGLYIEGSHGIRTENLILCVPDEKNQYGQFLRFEYLTYVPIDLDAIDPAYMTIQDKVLLNDYHRAVYEKISPYLEKEEAEWLKEATREI